MNRLAPDVLILLDASGSMNEDITRQPCTGGCGANSKWALLGPAINQIVSMTETTVNWGLKMFADADNSCGVSPNTVAVPVAANNAAAIQAAIAGADGRARKRHQRQSDPDPPRRNAATAYLSTLTDVNPKYILLATDGLPNCMGPRAPAAAHDDSAGAINAVANAATAGFQTYVVGIATAGGVEDFTLDQMAVAGQVPRAGTPAYYPVTSSAEFVQTLRQIVGSSTSCTFAVPPPPTPNHSRNAIEVWIEGTRIPRDPGHTSGWDYGDAGTASIVFYGARCEAIKSGAIQTVTLNFQCIN